MHSQTSLYPAQTFDGGI